MSFSPVSITLPLSKWSKNSSYLPFDIILIISNQIINYNFSLWWDKQILERKIECNTLCSILGKHMLSSQLPFNYTHKCLNRIACSLQARLNLFRQWDQLLLNGLLPQEPGPNTPKMTIAWILQWKQSRGV